jgi:membrane protein implicated in regulation of membrane protease activity
LTDWLGENAWAIWLSIAFLLAVAEVLSLDLVLIMLAAGAVAGAGVAIAAPHLWWLQIIVALSVSFGMLLLLRPAVLAKVRNMPGYRSSASKMVGSTGIAMSEITRGGPSLLVGPGDRGRDRDRGLRDRRRDRRRLSAPRIPALTRWTPASGPESEQVNR